MNAKKTYEAPEFVELGSIVESTGHCSDGCDHDSVIHPDEFKSSGTAELSGDTKGGENEVVAIGC